MFRGELEALTFPLRAQAQASQLEQDASDVITSLRRLAQTSDLRAYQSGAAQFQDLGNRFDRDVQTLYDDLVGT